MKNAKINKYQIVLTLDLPSVVVISGARNVKAKQVILKKE